MELTSWPPMLRVLLCTALLALPVAACGDAPTLPRGGVLQVGLTEYRMTPDHARVHAGAVTLQVQNLGRLAHNLEVAHGSTRIAVTRPIPPGTGTYLELWLMPGSYTLASTLFSDQALGIYGTLTVVR